MYKNILYEVDDSVAVITLNRPERLNAWSDAMGEEVRQSLCEAESDPAVVGIVITGAGKAFCAGADLADLQAISDAGNFDIDSAETNRRTPGDPDCGAAYQQKYSYLSSIRKPFIAAINGATCGMALPIAFHCDMRFGSSNAMFMSAFAQRGLVAEWGACWLLTRLVGVAHTMDILLSSRKIRAKEALQMGLLNRVIEDEDLLEHCKLYIREMTAMCSPQSMAIIKKQVYQSLSQSLSESLDEANRLMSVSLVGEDAKEGVQSFIENRQPNFKRLPNKAAFK